MKLIEVDREKVVLEFTREEYRLVSMMSTAVSEEYDVLEYANLLAPEEDYDRMFDEFSKIGKQILQKLGNEEE
jgi:hypothetical protein